MPRRDSAESPDARRRLLASVTRRHRELHHLVHGPRVDPEPPRRRPLAQTLNANRMPNLQIIVHVLHPPPSADSRQKGYPLSDFYSGATGNPGLPPPRTAFPNSFISPS